MPDRALRSLNRFADVVFALMFVRTVEFLPSFQDGRRTQLPHGLLSLLASQPANLTRVVFGLLVILYYWSRKNTLVAVLAKSNAIFATLSIAGLSFICLFLWALAADPMYIGGPPTLLLQSLSLAIASLFGLIALRYAIDANLTQPDLKASAERLARVDITNPLTAAIAAALSWSGLTIWTLSWFVLMPLFSFLLARRPPFCIHAIPPRASCILQCAFAKPVRRRNAIWHKAFYRGPAMHAPWVMHRNATRPHIRGAVRGAERGQRSEVA
ncbi:MAG: hypothetical protein WCC84_17855 [Candidatus Cybelea sp.]